MKSILTIKAEKIIKVTKIAGKYRYQFGYIKRPERVFENHCFEVIERLLHWNELVLQNGNYFDTLYQKITELDYKYKIKAGVMISHNRDGNYQNNQYLNKVLCSNNMITRFPDELS